MLESAEASWDAEKETVEGLNKVVDELKNKLKEAMETLQKNSETIEFLNQSLTEA